MNLDALIRKVPDFPKPGIMFYDITSLFMNPEALDFISKMMLEAFEKTKIDAVISIESRGFILGGIFAKERKLPLVLARKQGKLPCETIGESYDLEYGQATLEIHKADISPGKRYVVVDDLIATGGTVRAVATMIEKSDAEVAGVFAIISLPFLRYAEKIGKYKTIVLREYHGESPSPQANAK
ncbi:MAG: adenine phosphoribosyltransferase [Deltaproteobacteria bacterium]|jgi:adenine phosphoribosyltransferase|nr:adenine phosphoribosyltransferase [Deltaproteobacteria bacterium]